MHSADVISTTVKQRSAQHQFESIKNVLFLNCQCQYSQRMRWCTSIVELPHRTRRFFVFLTPSHRTQVTRKNIIIFCTLCIATSNIVYARLSETHLLLLRPLSFGCLKGLSRRLFVFFSSNHSSSFLKRLILLSTATTARNVAVAPIIICVPEKNMTTIKTKKDKNRHRLCANVNRNM